MALLFNRNRKDGNPEISNKATIYLNGVKQDRCLEARTLGPVLKGPGYVINYAPASDTKRTLYGLPVVKTFGFVTVEL